MYISSIRTNFGDGTLPAEIYLTGPTAQRWAVTKFPPAQAPSAVMLADPSFRVVVSAERSADFLRWAQAALDPNADPNRPLWQTWGDDVVDRLQAAYDRIRAVRPIPASVGTALQRDRSYSGQASRPQISAETLALAMAIAASDGRDDQVVFEDVSLPVGAALPQYGVRVYDATSYTPGRFSASAWTETPAPAIAPPVVPPPAATQTAPPAPPAVTPPPAPPAAAPPGTITATAKVSIVPWLLGAAAVVGVAWWLWPKDESGPRSNPSHSFIGSHVTRLGHGASAGRHGTILALEGHGPMMTATVRWEDGSVGTAHGKDLGLIG